MSTESVHKAGAHRHKERWLYANQRAVEAASASGINYSGEKERACIALIVLRVLDGQMVDTGHIWSLEAGKWITRQSQEVAERLMGKREVA